MLNLIFLPNCKPAEKSRNMSRIEPMLIQGKFLLAVNKTDISDTTGYLLIIVFVEQIEVVLQRWEHQFWEWGWILVSLRHPFSFVVLQRVQLCPFQLYLWVGGCRKTRSKLHVQTNQTHSIDTQQYKSTIIKPVSGHAMKD